MSISRRIAGLAVATVVGVASIAGCASTGATSPAGQSGSDGAATSHSATRPAPLTELAVDAEALFASLPGEDWPAAESTVAAMTTAWTGFQPHATADGVPPAAADKIDIAMIVLKKEVADHNLPVARQTTNTLLQALVDASAPFDLGHPIGIEKLGVVVRQAILDAASGDLAAAGLQIELARLEIDALTPGLAEHGGSRTASEAAAAAKAAADAAKVGDIQKVEAQAGTLLDLAIAMESSYQ